MIRRCAANIFYTIHLTKEKNLQTTKWLSQRQWERMNYLFIVFHCGRKLSFNYVTQEAFFLNYTPENFTYY